MPSDYTLRYSKKAKYMQLKLSSHGLEVVLPIHEHFPPQLIEQFIQKKQTWIEKNKQQFRNIQSQEKNGEKISESSLPTVIFFNAIDQQWRVNYLSSSKKNVICISGFNQQITLVGDITKRNLCLNALHQWLKEIAYYHLHPQLILLSKQTRLTFKQITIRHNKTRWGSCSNKGNINLCSKLLFLPSPLLRHILLHELCHLKILNHGNDFWKLLLTFDAEAKKHATELKKIFIPDWV